eukprot:EG_transcript_50192
MPHAGVSKLEGTLPLRGKGNQQLLSPVWQDGIVFQCKSFEIFPKRSEMDRKWCYWGELHFKVLADKMLPKLATCFWGPARSGWAPLGLRVQLDPLILLPVVLQKTTICGKLS